ncbi:MAG: hypothetical protein NTV01_06045 [Bacteroidia bacterium]|nr:hypothetical protein [Bacteroidia bacterium]
MVENAHFADGKHDYGFDKRQAAYKFLAKHLKLNANTVLTGEEWVRILATEDLRVTD